MTIEERANEYYKNAQRRDELYNDDGEMYSCVPKMAFIAGARSEHQELTKWHSLSELDKNEMNCVPILLKVIDGEIGVEKVVVGCYNKMEVDGFSTNDAFFKKERGDKFVGWRRIRGVKFFNDETKNY